jgi:hypothetical protein
MNLCEFLHFNQECPVCGEPLTLYAQVLDGPLWKAKRPTIDVYHFEQLKCKDEELKTDDFFWITEQSNTFDVDFSSSKVYQKSKTWTMFFFFMCNQDGIEDTPREGYGINPYIACYYRSTPFMDFKQNPDHNWRLVRADEFDAIEGSIRDEIFVFKANQNNGNEKVYVFNTDYESKSTILRYYTVSPDDRKNKEFDPKVFKKELPLLNVRPNFNIEQREHLISRFDSWILMS